MKDTSKVFAISSGPSDLSVVLRAAIQSALQGGARRDASDLSLADLWGHQNASYTALSVPFEAVGTQNDVSSAEEVCFPSCM